MEEVLSVQNLIKTYGDITAVDNVSFNVKKGDIMGLVGPNGAGKTTTIRIIMGILSQNKGEVTYYVNGKSTSMDKTQIGYLPEERGLYDDVNVLDNLIYLGTLKAKPRSECRTQGLHWLKKVGLEEYAYKKLEKLSKGMQQKVQFIGAVLHKPKLLMLDEPFSGLDPVNQEFFKEIIYELQKEGTAILLSAHQMNLIEELCDTVFFINEGKQVLYGSINEIKREYSEYIVDIHYKEDEDVSFLTSIQGVEVTRKEGGRILMRYSGGATTSDLVQTISSNLELEDISVQKPSLHDIFIQTVKKRGGNIEEA